MATTIDEGKAREHRERMASQSWYDVDSKLSVFLDLLFGEDDEHREGSGSLTVVTQGTVISGQVVSAAKYQEDQAASLEAASPELATSLRRISSVWHELKDERKALSESSDLPSLRADVHFGTATIFSGAGKIEVTNLSVDLKDVSAWAIGSLG